MGKHGGSARKQTRVRSSRDDTLGESEEPQLNAHKVNASYLRKTRATPYLILIDVVVENDRLAVVTAKDKPGLTNIIVLDEGVAVVGIARQGGDVGHELAGRK